MPASDSRIFHSFAAAVASLCRESRGPTGLMSALVRGPDTQRQVSTRPAGSTSKHFPPSSRGRGPWVPKA